ncbi:hypothetical protein AXK56_19170 [Tsukamurella pulmonis]|uniref:Uncharacterized protein n=1 Tax=Tsukamurella pulmonis TaxID=47312 RepID=A0A1H1HGE9_9ACTN|nr:hypothetical protein [Tsukamurella pulmonis]KXO94738.1 hypothetical protein AXK56_19170 [Tsukamurella pulmonis]SDR24432.1 hypothetical protein SAMN04489765_4162 [Tsukamurella pulmonis]SUP14764.1 Uncharacterised protein [Tsukamurella pulmonis]
MSEERRISLAELLAREGGTAPAPTGGRRRRHRGGENSITVAELTGEIPVVRDDQPAPGSDPAAQAAAPAEPAAPEAGGAPEQATAAQAPQQPAPEHRTPAPEAVEPEVVEPEIVEPPAPAAEQAGSEQSDDEPITSSFLAAAVADPGLAEAPEPAEQAQVEQAPAEPEAPAEREPRRSGLLRWNRGASAEPAQPEADTAPAQDDAQDAPAEAPQEAAAQAEDGTDYAWSRWDQAETPIMATADFNTAQVRERQSRFADAPADDTVDVAPVAVPDGEGEAPSTPDTAALSAQQIGEARTEEPSGFLAKKTDADADDAGEDAAEKSGGTGRGWLVLAAEVVLGLAAGAGLFYGFFKLWNWGGGKATIALTVVLAFIVIIGIVTFTHYLRKTTDYLTLGLALFVGLVITFGPLLMALGSN